MHPIFNIRLWYEAKAKAKREGYTLSSLIAGWLAYYLAE